MQATHRAKNNKSKYKKIANMIKLNIKPGLFGLVKLGLFQNSVVGPTLFLCYTNDTVKVFDNFKTTP